MTKKHFEMIAAEFKRTLDVLATSVTDDPEVVRRASSAQQALKYTAENLATQFAQANPNFDRARFLTAAGF